MKNCYRVVLGRKNVHAEECFAKGFVGVDFDIDDDLSGKLPENWHLFNQAYIPKYLAALPGKSKVAAGLACGSLWTVAKFLQKGDMVVCPDGARGFRVGEVTGDYYYQQSDGLQHRRPVRWFDKTIDRADMSEALSNSTRSIGMVSNLTQYLNEIEGLIACGSDRTLISTDATVENPTSFALEKHLEDFLVENWAQTELSIEFDIYEEEGERVGQQYPTDTGPIDILAVSKDKKTLLVIELKKGRASDVVVGQTLRYMGCVKEELAEEGQGVKGVIIALEDDPRIRRALAVTPNIDFYRYQISFKLLKNPPGNG